MSYDKDTIEFQPKPTNPRFKDLTGRVFGRLTVLGFGGMTTGSYRHPQWFVECECGNVRLVDGSHLPTGHTTSCGCWTKERTSAAKGRHWLSRTSTYRIWAAMKDRCCNPHCTAYPHYGGRGIRVCERWHSDIANFVQDMGIRPKGLSIDRIDVHGHYSCGHCDECIANGWTANCRWATNREQALNRTDNKHVTYQDRTQPLVLWCDELHLNYSRVSARLRHGWNVERAFTEPIRRWPSQI